MKKIKNVFMAIIAILMIAVGCAKIDSAYVRGNMPVNSNGETAIVFSNYATKSVSDPSTTHSYTHFDVYAWKDEVSTVMFPYSVTFTNNEWNYDNDANQELQYFDRNSVKYDFLGVITGGTVTPSNNSVALNVTGVKAFENNDDEATTDDELLWAQATVAKAAYDSEVALTFNHANAKMYVGFVSDGSDTQILDYTPTIPANPGSPGTPDTETYTKKTTKFIDELVAGSEVQVAIGFYGAGSPKLTSTQPNPIYVGTNNDTWKSKDWLLSIKDAVNAQFVYYRLNEVNNSTSKTVTTEDWESAASNKNIFMMKLADGVDKAEFAAGNDAFSTALKAHQTDWYGGSSPAQSFWAVFEKAYNEGWRVIRINVSDANANQVLVFLSSNMEVSTQVCTITPGTPTIPATSEVPGINGIRVFSVSTNATTGKNVRTAHTTEASAVLTNTCVLTQTDNSGDGADSNVTFVKPNGTVAQVTDFDNITENTTVTWSPTVWYALPVNNPDNGYVVKFSYTYNGVSYYDARVHIPFVDSNFEQGKYYRYVICIGNKTNGSTDPDDAKNEKD